MSNLLKQCFVVNSTEGTRIINSDQYLKEHISKKNEESHENLSDGLRELTENEETLLSVEEEKAKLEQFRKDMIANAQTMANQITATAEAKANGMLEAAKQSAQELFEEQRKLGYDEGNRQSAQELEASKKELEQEYEQRKQQLQTDYEARMEHMESDIVDAVVQVFEKVFQIQFSDKRTILLALIKNTLMDVDAGNKVRIHVNEADHRMLMEHLEEIQKQLGGDVSVEFVQDNKFADGQCQIETSYGVFDCGVDTQLSNLIKDIRSLV